MFGEVRLTELLTIDKTCIRYMSLTSISLVLVSTVGMCLNTMQTFRYYDANKEPMDNPYLALIEVLRPSAQCTVVFLHNPLYRSSVSPGSLWSTSSAWRELRTRHVQHCTYCTTVRILSNCYVIICKYAHSTFNIADELREADDECDRHPGHRPVLHLPRVRGSQHRTAR